jgi:hypothetical protein
MRTRSALWSLRSGALAVGCATASACSADRAAAPHAEEAPAGAAAAIAPGPYLPGRVYYGRNNYIEYDAGNLPVIISAPHGGGLRPAELRDRDCGLTGTDRNTEQLARAIRSAFFRRTGRYPHVVINRLARAELDANRDSAEATCGDATTRISWHDFHDFLDSAKASVKRQYARGLYIDLHGQSHPIRRLELGYLLDSLALRQSNATLDATTTYEARSSIYALSRRSPSTFSALLRGSQSLGTLYQARGYPAVPSTEQPNPGPGNPYFTGGANGGAYNTPRHGCRPGNDGAICGVQLETYYVGVRDSVATRARFADTTVKVVDLYLNLHYQIDITP